MSKKRVFVDTNIILEAFRINCWKEICNQFSIETVEKCTEEALTGDQLNPHYTKVDIKILQKGLTTCHKVTKQLLANLALSHPECRGLDDGELHLLAWLHDNSSIPELGIVISTADKAAIRATHLLGWLDHVESLEQLATGSGVAKSKSQQLKIHFQSR